MNAVNCITVVIGQRSVLLLSAFPAFSEENVAEKFPEVRAQREVVRFDSRSFPTQKSVPVFEQHLRY